MAINPDGDTDIKVNRIDALSGSDLTLGDNVLIESLLHPNQLKSALMPDDRIKESNVTQHQAALSIAASQLTGTISTSNLPINGIVAKFLYENQNPAAESVVGGTGWNNFAFDGEFNNGGELGFLELAYAANTYNLLFASFTATSFDSGAVDPGPYVVQFRIADDNSAYVSHEVHIDARLWPAAAVPLNFVQGFGNGYGSIFSVHQPAASTNGKYRLQVQIAGTAANQGWVAFAQLYAIRISVAV